MTHQSEVAKLEVLDNPLYSTSLFRDIHSGALFNILWPCSDLFNFGISLYRDGKRIGAGTARSCRPGSRRKQFVGLGAIALVNGYARSADVPLDYLLADYFSPGDWIEIHDDHQSRESRDDQDFFSVIFSEFLKSAPAEEMLLYAWERAFHSFWAKKQDRPYREWSIVRSILRGTFHFQYGRSPDVVCQSLAREFEDEWAKTRNELILQWRKAYSGENAEPMLWLPD
jgi:hypothetical protein